MTLQVIVDNDDVEIVKRERGGTLSIRLKLFADGADPDIADPLLDVTESADIKAKADDKTIQQLVNDATRIAGKALEKEALTYVRIAEYKSLVNTDAVKAGIEDALGV